MGNKSTISNELLENKIYHVLHYAKNWLVVVVLGAVGSIRKMKI